MDYYTIIIIIIFNLNELKWKKDCAKQACNIMSENLLAKRFWDNKKLIEEKDLA